MKPRLVAAPATHEERQRTLAKLIVADADNFNMEVWFTKGGGSLDLGAVQNIGRVEDAAHAQHREPTCGTTACAAGMAVYHWGDTIARDISGMDGEVRWLSEWAVADWLGISKDMFHTPNWPYFFQQMAHDIADANYDEDHPQRYGEAQAVAAMLELYASGGDPWAYDELENDPDFWPDEAEQREDDD